MGNGASVDNIHSYYIAKFEGLSDTEKEIYSQNYKALIAANHGMEEALELLENQYKQEQEVCRLKEEEEETTETDKTEINVAMEQQVEIELTKLQDAIQQALLGGRTPLIIDRSADHKVDTFMGYGNAIQLDAKKMGLDKSMRKIPVPEIMEEARKKLVAALKHGYTLAITMSNSVTDFATVFNDESAGKTHGLDLEGGSKAFFPLQLFENGGKNLISNEKVLEALYSEADKELTAGLAIAKESFNMVITSHFSPSDFEEYLFANEWGLPKPKEKYQFIIIKYPEDVELIE